MREKRRMADCVRDLPRSAVGHRGQALGFAEERMAQNGRNSGIAASDAASGRISEDTDRERKGEPSGKGV